VVGNPRSGDGRDDGAYSVRSFLGQVISGAALLVLLTVHMTAQQLTVPTGLRYYEDVIAWLRNPVVVVVEVAFLAFVTWHALLGVRAILFDIGFGEGTERLITRVLSVVGIATVVYGVALFAMILNAA
jgi:succinate dehydrogenase hydrophobic anchor subunit